MKYGLNYLVRVSLFRTEEIIEMICYHELNSELT